MSEFALLEIKKILDDPYPDAGLTALEKRVVVHASHGYSLATVAHHMGKSRNTVKAIAHRASKKIGFTASVWRRQTIAHIKVIVETYLRK